MANRAQLESYLNLPSVKAFLDVIGWAEGAGYNTGFGGRYISDLTWHPYAIGQFPFGNSTTSAAGRYQFERGTWNGIAAKLGLPDFSPHSQDIAALGLIDERGELGTIVNGNLLGTLQGLGCLWASLPYSGCGQGQRSLSSVTNYYNGALGVYGGVSAINTTTNYDQNGVPDAVQNDDSMLYVVGGLIALALLL